MRFGDFKQGKDDNISYDGLSVTSSDYMKKCRVDSKFGAHDLTYEDKDGANKSAIVLFDDKQKTLTDGKEQELSGINLQDLADIRATIFHEWTHVIERCKVKVSQLTREDIVHQAGNSIYINSMLSPELSKQELEDYVANIDTLLQSDAEIPFGGISTIELNNQKNPNQRIMHNQISEGATEFIARKVMENIGEKVPHSDRYSEQVKIIGSIFEGKGLPDYLTMYLINPHKLTKILENEKVGNKDKLHYISDYINSSHISRLFNRCKIDKDGNVQLGIIQRVGNKIKSIFLKDDVAMLPQGKQNSNANVITRNEFLESLKVSPEEIIQNAQQQEKINKITEQIKDEQGRSLDD